ncbi:MAG: protein kinase [Anaerolineae bacterium]
MQGNRFFPGQKIDQYILGEQIAAGGMGQVFLAFQESMNRHVAIKFLPPVDSENADTVARFEREVYMISRLEHPHIVPVYGFGDIYGVPYIVMRHMSGGTLREHFQDGRLNLQRILAVVDQMVTALDYAHEQGIIHRDIKPSNIFLDERNNAYLADFGLAKTVSGSHDLTRTDEGISGTPEYMSPEQVRGQKLDGRTDIYSLGIIVFQLLSGQAPFSGSNPMETVLMQISNPIPSIHTLQPELPETLDTIFKQVLAKTSDERYQSGKEFAADLHEALDGKRLNWMPTSGNGLVNIEPEAKTAEGPKVDDLTEKRIDVGHNGSVGTIGETIRVRRWVERPEQLILYSILAAFLVIGLAIGGYQLFSYLNNPVRQLDVPVINAEIASPLDLEFDGQGSVWVIDNDAGEVNKLQADCETGATTCGSLLDKVNVGSRPTFLALGNNELLVGRQIAQGLTAISLDDSSMRLIDFPHIPADAVVYGDSIWISSGQDLIELDENGQILESFVAGITPSALYQTEDYIWVALEGEARIRRFNLIMRDFDFDLRLSPIKSNQLISLTGDPANQQIWASFNRDNTLIQIDSVTGALLGSYTTGEFPVDIAVYDSRIWVAAKDADQIVVHNGLSGTLIGEVTVIDAPLTMAVEPCGIGCAYLWVASEATNSIHRIDVTSIE